MHSRTRTLLGLTLGVSAVHVSIMGSRPSLWLAQPNAAPLVLETRMVSPPPAAKALTPKAAVKPVAQAQAATPRAPKPVPPHEAQVSPEHTQPGPTSSEANNPNVATAVEVEPTSVTKASGVPTPPTQIPPSVTMKYEVSGTAKGFSYSANAELVFVHDGKQYDARLTVGAFLLGSRVDTSQGQIGVTGLEPLRYSQKSRGERAAHFQRDKGLITFSSNRPEVALQSGAQDRLSVLLQLAALIAADPQRASPGQNLVMQVAGVDNAEPWTFKVEEPETLSLPAGELRTLKLQRLPKGEYAQRVEVWLSPTHAYLPLRLRITNSNGDVVDQLWRN